MPSRLATAVLSTLALALASGWMATGAAAVPALSWPTTADAFDTGMAPAAVSCADESLCVAVDGHGRALVTLDPAAAAPSWSATSIDPEEHPLTAVSCTPGGLCAAVDGHGQAFVKASASAPSWGRTTIDGSTLLTGVSCPTSSLCVAVDETGDVLTSAEPSGGGWASVTVDAGHALKAVSCSSASLCVAVDEAGDVLSSVDPRGGAAAWHLQRVDFAALVAVSCSAAGPCVAVDNSGDAFVSADPGASPATWSLTPLVGVPLSGVSCASSGLCVAVNANGGASASDDPAQSAPAWSTTSVDARALTGVSCLPGGLCVAVDTAGGSLSARVPAPTATTATPGEVTASSALLSGAVNPNDAVLSACTFEYGTTSAGEQSIPCSATPAPTGGVQGVSASAAGLAANTTYRYRLLASAPAGTGTGAEVTFTTPTSSQIPLATPHPSIAGTPAVGQRLTCNTGVAAGVAAQVSYAWVRDQIPISGSKSSTYTVKGQDSGHHLQCQVTATDGGGSATAKSAFVSIPVGGPPAAVGETTVGAATFTRGKLLVPVACAASASAGCEIALRLSAVKAPSGKRAQRTVTLLSTHARVPAGAHRTIVSALSATGKRLLASGKSVAAALYVSGTVVGVIEAELARQTLTVSKQAKAAARTTASTTGRLLVATARPATHHAPAARDASVLAATPYMGWDTYFALGGRYSESSVLEQASKLITLGLAKRGYRYVWLDVGWWKGTREANGQIAVSTAQWPHGIAWLTRTLHAAGLLVGIYTDAGPNGCGGAGQGSYGHYQQDADTFASWGIDAVKVDFCGGAEYQLEPASAYAQFHAALVDSGRPMLLSICDYLQPEEYGEGRPSLETSAFASYTFGPSVGNSWRTDTDVGSPGDVPFSSVLRNMDADATDPQAAGPGHWNDPDYLAPDQGMSATQFRTQLSMWSMLAAPLMVSDDLTKITSASLTSVQNSEVIAVDQDAGGAQATLLSSAGNGQVWVKPLLGGGRAIALLNRGSGTIEIATSASAAGLAAARSYSVRNLWTHKTSSTSGVIAAEVPADATVLLRVTPGRLSA